MQNNDYINREEASKAITELMSSPWATEGPHSIGIKEALSLVRDMIRGNVPKGMQIPDADVRPVVRWIPVEERLPEACETVLVYRVVSGGYVQLTEICFAHTLKIYDKVTWSEVGVTHWMPLPEAPEIGDLQ